MLRRATTTSGSIRTSGPTRRRPPAVKRRPGSPQAAAELEFYQEVVVSKTFDRYRPSANVGDGGDTDLVGVATRRGGGSGSLHVAHRVIQRSGRHERDGQFPRQNPVAEGGDQGQGGQPVAWVIVLNPGSRTRRRNGADRRM